MKFNHALLALAISVSGIAFASEKDHDTKPLHGGVLSIAWAGAAAPVMMTGPAASVFRGEIDLPDYL